MSIYGPNNHRMKMANIEAKFHLDPEFKVVREAERNRIVAVDFEVRGRKYGVSGRVSGEELTELFAAQDRRCAEPRCRQPLVTRGQYRFNWDHRIPMGRGGPNWIWNLQALCPYCDQLKARYTQGEFGRMKWEKAPNYLELRMAEIAEIMKPISWRKAGRGWDLADVYWGRYEEVMEVARRELVKWRADVPKRENIARARFTVPRVARDYLCWLSWHAAVEAGVILEHLMREEIASNADFQAFMRGQGHGSAAVQAKSLYAGAVG